MSLNWKIYKYLLIANLLLSIICITLFCYGSMLLKIPGSIFKDLLLVVTSIAIIHSGYFFWLINSRFPDKGLNSLLEGCGYMLNVAICISCMYMIFFASTVLSVFIENYQPGFIFY